MPWTVPAAPPRPAAARPTCAPPGLPASDKPASACLSSRTAYGVPVTREALRRAGFGGRFRVRDQGGDLARIEVEAAGIARAAAS